MMLAAAPEIGRGACLALIVRTGICWGLHQATSRWSPLSWPLDLLHAFIRPTTLQRAHLPSDVAVLTARQRVVACARAPCPLFCELSPRRRPPWAFLNTNTRDDLPGTRPLSMPA